MKTLDEMWDMFLQDHGHLSMEDLQDIKKYSEMAYEMGELSGLLKAARNVSRETILTGVENEKI